ncbi:hypothetical protein PCANC_20902 [Puccinia coronata f. sp. avenae]|uniref:Ubiquinone biosynthesis protein COQ9 HTH domain-containing protein n=1 Tax=Puccinia coronata f. sp. avenae TaxID=200324 RepID=A0A2N5SBF6_9BASI|nr:hypothetical protein PCASD_22429 [Puccinia coronata f. sp. avenae]PLW14351.1 hypothetical protein PCANC_20902 [Puccinia coronata f. sp. avenae]PLW29221.1 hypothetical protein PCASD_20903 [Puccinia coronata f. sp. avenae]
MLPCSARRASAARVLALPRVILPSASLSPRPCRSLRVNGSRDGHRTVWSAAPSISRRGFSSGATTRASASTMEKATPEHMLPDRLLMAALPFVPTHGFTSEAILAGVDSEPELARLEITSWTLSGLFPSTTAKAATVAGLAGRAVPRSEPIGPSKALAERWIQEGNSRMMASVKNEQLTFKLHGLVGVRRAFEIRLSYNRTIPKEFLLNALALMATPKDPFFGVSLPLELPHVLPYGSHALDVATDALAALRDYSKSREWMLRRIRLAGVYTAVELMHISIDLPPTDMSTQIQKLLDASESLATHTGNTVEFLSYVRRSQQSIIRSFGLI